MASLDMVVDSPPGMTRPSTSASSSGAPDRLARASRRRPRASQVLPYIALEGQDSDERGTLVMPIRRARVYQPRLA